jgi:hypothetical protein
VTPTTIVTKSPATTDGISQSEVALIVPTTVTVGQESEVSATTTTSIAKERVKNAAIEPATVAPRIAEADPGDGSLTIGGQEVEATLERVNDQIVLNAAEMSATVSAISKDGSTTPLDGDGVLRLGDDDQIRVAATGFAPDSEVEIWLFSTPVLLGKVTVAGDGSASAIFEIPTGTESGNHRVALNGKNSNGDDASFVVGFVFGDSPSGVSAARKLLISIPIGFAMFAALLVPARRRRKVSLV